MLRGPALANHRRLVGARTTLSMGKRWKWVFLNFNGQNSTIVWHFLDKKVWDVKFWPEIKFYSNYFLSFCLEILKNIPNLDKIYSIWFSLKYIR